MRTALLAVSALLALHACGSAPPRGGPGPVRSEAVPAAASAVPSADAAFYPSWSRSAVIYEVNVRQYTPEGTFAALERHLPRLDSLGVDILWLMPVQPIGVKNRKGGLGSYYSIADYTAVNPEHGTAADFRRFVDAA
ncbi:MAG TPA: alpha-amylase family glycosyl hydrolase, partial [Longimicrobiaceae bacterium]|nr:alpha-amylase family glycosyl hydrolase [Longimicrobiaceae bacterium]